MKRAHESRRKKARETRLAEMREIFSELFPVHLAATQVSAKQASREVEQKPDARVGDVFSRFGR